MFYITGDMHGNFTRAMRFCKEHLNRLEHDTMIVLGDAGINYFGDMRDAVLKNALARLPLTLFCIHGNHEMRPDKISSYTEIEWHGGMVYMEPAFPKILFAKDGDIYDMDGIKTIAIGGAYSVDKYHRLEKGYRWFEDEQPSKEIRKRVEDRLDGVEWEVDAVLSHTCPVKYEPVEMFLQVVDQSTVDKSTEIWLDSIENRLTYKRWFCAHYHTEKQIDKLQFLYQSIQPF